MKKHDNLESRAAYGYYGMDSTENPAEPVLSTNVRWCSGLRIDAETRDKEKRQELKRYAERRNELNNELAQAEHKGAILKKRLKTVPQLCKAAVESARSIEERQKLERVARICLTGLINEAKDNRLERQALRRILQEG